VRAMAGFDYVPVKIDNLPLGVYLECKMYFRKENEMVLLCENATLNAGVISRFKKIMSTDTNVYISRRYIMEFFDRGIHLGFTEEEAKRIRENADKAEPVRAPAAVKKINQFATVVKKYETVKAESESFLQKITETGKIDAAQEQRISEEVENQIETTDITLLVQSINRIRSIDEYLHTHCLNVAFLNGIMGRWLKLDKKSRDNLVKIGLLHDIGKLKIPPEILNKPGKLTKEEFEVIKKHPTYSLEILLKSGIRNKVILEGVAQHHEKVNGTGYPDGLGAESICDFAKITAISDIYDAMVTRRVYKDAHSPFEILFDFSVEGYSELDVGYVMMFIDCMIEELKGKKIMLNNGSPATVVMVNPRNLRFPLVEVDGNIITTDENIYCTRMYNV